MGILKYGEKMTLKQISLSMPENLFEISKKHTKEFGYRNIQELLLELLRKRLAEERYKTIEKEMKAGKNVKKFNQKNAAKYIRKL